LVIPPVLGGARALRNIPVFVQFAEDFNRYAPTVNVLNYTNPMTVLTAVLDRLCKAPVIGLCHGLFENLEFFQKLLRLPPGDELSLRYAGLNHFFWMLDARAGGIDMLSKVRKRLARSSMSEL